MPIALKPGWRRALVLLVTLGVVALAWVYQRPLTAALQNMDQAHTWLQSLGPLGPLALIAINILQIVVAPIPGYFVQAAAGWAFGLWPGALYGTIGMVLGGGLAALLARYLGRPFVTRIIGAERLARWEQVVHADRPWVWAVLLLGPVGDIPYYLAGLSQFPVPRLMLLAALVRGPSVLLASAVGAGVVSLSPSLLALTFAAVLVALAFWYFWGGRVRAALESRFLRQLHSPSTAAPDEG